MRNHPPSTYKVERRGDEVVVTYRGNVETSFPVDKAHSEADAYSRAHEYVQGAVEAEQNPAYGSQQWAETYSDDLGESPDY